MADLHVRDAGETSMKTPEDLFAMGGSGTKLSYLLVDRSQSSTLDYTMLQIIFHRSPLLSVVIR